MWQLIQKKTKKRAYKHYTKTQKHRTQSVTYKVVQCSGTLACELKTRFQFVSTKHIINKTYYILSHYIVIASYLLRDISWHTRLGLWNSGCVVERNVSKWRLPWCRKARQDRKIDLYLTSTVLSVIDLPASGAERYVVKRCRLHQRPAAGEVTAWLEPGGAKPFSAEVSNPWSLPVMYITCTTI